MPNEPLLADLRAIVGDWGVVTGEPLTSRLYDEAAGEVKAQVLVRPRDTAQVSAVLKLCNSRGQTVVTHGGLTGLVFGCAARPAGTSRLIDRQERTYCSFWLS